MTTHAQARERQNNPPCFEKARSLSVETQGRKLRRRRRSCGSWRSLSFTQEDAVAYVWVKYAKKTRIGPFLLCLSSPTRFALSQPSLIFPSVSIIHGLLRYTFFCKLLIPLPFFYPHQLASLFLSPPFSPLPSHFIIHILIRCAFLCKLNSSALHFLSFAYWCVIRCWVHTCQHSLQNANPAHQFPYYLFWYSKINRSGVLVGILWIGAWLTQALFPTASCDEVVLNGAGIVNSKYSNFDMYKMAMITCQGDFYLHACVPA